MIARVSHLHPHHLGLQYNHEIDALPLSNHITMGLWVVGLQIHVDSNMVKSG